MTKRKLGFPAEDPDGTDALFNEVMAASAEEAERYCRERGIDVERLRKRLLRLIRILMKQQRSLKK